MAEISYLVTGGSGFIGSHLTDALLARGNSVTILDNLSTGRESNLATSCLHPRLRFLHGSVLDPVLVDELVSRCDTVIHLAAAVGVRLIVEQPLRSFTTNIRGTEVIFDAAHRYRRKLMLASTSEIYGKNSAGPLHEESDRILGSSAVARWAYSTAKGVDEVLANAYYRERGLPTIVVRLFNTVGPRQTGAYGMVVPRLVRQALRGEPLTVFGDGRQTRCFTHVADVVAAMMLLLDTEAAVGQTFNIGSPDEISIADLARLIIAECDSRSSPTFVPYDRAYASGFEDMERRIPDCTKLRSLTGWSPHRNLMDILRETIAEARAEIADEIPVVALLVSLLTPFVVVSAVAFGLTALFTEAMRRIALRYRLMDVPGTAKGHRAPTPYLGGAAIVISALAAWAIAIPPRDPQVLTLILTGTIISLLGLADDIRPLRVSVRLSIEFLAAGAVVASGARVGVFGSMHGTGNWCDIAITVLWIVLMTNSFNLLDNSDGAAASIAAVTAAALALLAFGAGSESIAVFLLAVSASCAGFLIHNWAPARIFMGDAGSLFLGFVTSASAVLVFGLHNGSVQPTSWADRASGLLLLTFVAAVDTGTVVVSRYRAGRPLMQGGTDHISHRLRVLGLRTSQAAALLSAVAGISCIFAVLVTFGTLPAVGSLTVVLAVGITVVVLAQWVPLEGRALSRSAPPGMPVRTATSSPPPAQAAARAGRRVSGSK